MPTTCVARDLSELDPEVEAPLSELQNYSNELKSMTGGQGAFTMDYSHDEYTPPHIQADIIAAYKPKADEE